MSETKEFRYSFHREARQRADFSAVSSPVWCYRGAIKDPKWKDIDSGMSISSVCSTLLEAFLIRGNYPENYTQLCNIVTDLSNVPLTPMTNPDGETYYRIYYDIVLLFGLTEMKALVAWKDKV